MTSESDRIIDQKTYFKSASTSLPKMFLAPTYGRLVVCESATNGKTLVGFITGARLCNQVVDMVNAVLDGLHTIVGDGDRLGCHAGGWGKEDSRAGTGEVGEA